MIKTNGKFCDSQCKFVGIEPIFKQVVTCNLFKKKLKQLSDNNTEPNLFYRCKLCLNITGDIDANKGISQTI